MHKKLNATGIGHVALIMIFVVGFALVGTYMLYISHADAVFAGCTAKGKATVTSVNSSSTETYYQTLGYGSTGTCVKSLQTKINQYCSPMTALKVDGSYGPKTTTAVKSVQRFFATIESSQRWRVNGKAISIDGVTGPQTWSAIQVFNNPYGTGSTRNGGVNCTYPRL
ncbi:MAG TPA: peptidoglycan-binding domain-containing protein [Candidatus Saccharimonadales bacterium]|nr:peptidoglycan-binding domain-containing protein [Candidatus Saccharimonadales bacterium]